MEKSKTPDSNKKPSKQRNIINAKGNAAGMLSGAMYERMMRQQLETSKSAEIHKKGTLLLPEIEAPALTGITVEIPRSEPPNEAMLADAISKLLRQFGREQAHLPGQKLKIGDEILVNTLGMYNRKIVPLTLRKEHWMTLNPKEPYEKSLSAQLVRFSVGDMKSVQLVLDDDFPIHNLRNKSIQLNVHIVAGRSIVLPDPRGPSFWRVAGPWRNYDEMITNVYKRIVAEKGRLDLAEVAEKVLETLADRAALKLAPELIDEAIRLIWLDAEGTHLKDLAFSADDQLECLQAWRQCPEIRHKIEQKLRDQTIVSAIAKQAKIETDFDNVANILDIITLEMDVDISKLKKDLRENPEGIAPIRSKLQSVLTMQHIMSQIKLVTAAPTEKIF